jgi:Arc/MetJ-type ribon-helix-helix transcriptional regulator
MNPIELAPEQRDWLEAVVADGRFPSVTAAIEAALLGLMIDHDLGTAESDAELEAALDAARASDARGESLSLDAFKARTAARLRRSA